MAVNRTLISGETTTTTDIEVLYTSPSGGGGTTITAFVAVNTTVASDNYTVYIVDNADPATDERAVILEQPVKSMKTDVPPETISQYIPAGGTIQVKTGVAGSIAFRASGNEF